MRPGIWLALLAVVVAPATTAGQDLARRVSAVGDGSALLTYPARPGIEICDQGIRFGDHNMMWNSRRGDEGPENCRSGPVEIELKVQRGSVQDIEVVRRLGDRTEGAVDLGSVSADQAVAFLFDVARNGGSGQGEEDAVFPAILADVDEVWKDLLTLARETRVHEDVRTSAVFWVGQEAADAATEGLAEMALDGDEEQGVRDAAVFALSQRPNDEAVPVLMEIARTAPGAETRRSAMFWLAESEDDRVLAFFEEILLGRGGRG